MRGNSVNQKALSVALFASRKAGDACPMDHWTSHDLRRTTRTGLARLGCPFEIGEFILGHRLPGVLDPASANEGAPWLYSYRRGSAARRLAILATYIRTGIIND